jgi:threonine dehydrogenase-like Zn-dependent dehydrogenase
MLALGLRKGATEAEAFTVAEPAIRSPHEVLIRALQTGICGSDRSVIANGLADPPPGEDFIILGHEGLGRVLAVGDEVEALSAGDLVVPTVRRGCGGCPACASGQSDFCFTGRYSERGLHKLHGFFAERYVEEAQYLVEVPPELLHVAVLTEPMSIMEKAVEQALFIQDRMPWACPLRAKDAPAEVWGHCKTALVVGAGPVGLLGLALVRLAGMNAWLVERKDPAHPKVQLARRLGADYVDSRGLTPEDMARQVGPVDLIVEATGASDLALSLIPVLGRNAIYVLTGIPRGSSEVCVDGNRILSQTVRMNQVIVGVVNANRGHFEAVLTDMAKMEQQFPGFLSSLITHRFALSDYREALGPRTPDQIKVIFEISVS